MLKYGLVFSLGMLLLVLAGISPQDDSLANQLVIASKQGNQTILSTLDIDSGTQTVLFTVDTPYTGFELSPNRDRLAYFAITPAKRSSDDYTSRVSFFIRDALSGASREIATKGYMIGNSSIATGIIPAWSPDGSRIAIVNKNEVGEPQFTILDTATGTTLYTVAANPLPRYAPVWLDNDYLVYFAEYCMRCGVGTFYLISPTAEVRSLLPVPDDRRNSDGLMGWLPTSRELVIYRNTDTLASDASGLLLRVNIDTGDFIKLPIENVSGYCSQLMLLDEANALVINQVQDNYQLQVLDLETGAKRSTEITVGLDACEIILSPDHTQVALPFTQGRLDELHIFDLASSQQTRIPISAYGRSLTWTPDGTGLFFQQLDLTANRSDIFMVKIEASEPYLLTSLAGSNHTFLGWLAQP